MDLIKKYFPQLLPQQFEKIAALGPLYEEWNRKINVISRKDMEHFYEHHVLHSLSIAKLFSFPENYHIMDLGCGGGFPGIPLAISFPQVHFHIVDSIRKKLFVVENVAAAVGLTNISTQHTRAEEIKDRKFDLVISRAVAPLKTLWDWSYPLLTKNVNEKRQDPHGLICLKGGELENEMAESGKNPRVWDIHTIFKEDFFRGKYLLYIRDRSA